MASITNNSQLDLCNLSIATYNMHGYNQGSTFLKEMCTVGSFDIIFIQEHWLGPSNLNKILCISENYVGFGISAMESVLSIDFLRGRPFGGTCILVKKSLSNCCRNIDVFDRAVSVIVCDVLFINAYMPCEDGSVKNLDSLHEILANLSSIIEQSEYEFIAFGGDMNVNLSGQSPHSVAINDFLLTYKLFFGKKELASNIVNSPIPMAMDFYTFSNEKLNRYTTIDFLCFSRSLRNNVVTYDTVEDASNHSDHLPVCAVLNLPSMSSYSTHLKSGHVLYCATKCDKDNADIKHQSSLRWDHAKLDDYYNTSRNLLYPIYNELMHYNGLDNVNNTIFNDVNTRQSDEVCAFFDNIYTRSVDALRSASELCIPRIPQYSLKAWWNSDLTKLKNQSIATHQIWIAAGKPRVGLIFDSKNKDKINYKSAIKKFKNASAATISDKLHESLIYKNPTSFWKTWKSKVCKTNKNKISIKGNPSDAESVKLFAKFFEKTTTPNNESFNAEKQAEYFDKLPRYTGEKLSATRHNFSAELVGCCLDKLNAGKSGGADTLTKEHLYFSHPIICSLLATLFNYMLKFSHVPDSFGRGITIPIPKNDNCKGGHDIDSFRGITLSPIVSKLFEHCIIVIFSRYFKTNDHQFGFKPKVGCQHAIYAVRKVVEYYVENNSTINLCFLDLSKGFDKINNYLLLLKLMKRGLPVALIKLFNCWFNNSYNQVRFCNFLSEPYKILAGVRQGGVLSPLLFSIYIDDLVKKYKKHGCCYKGMPASAIVYADDILLLASSISELQRMIDICHRELILLDLMVNPSKTVAMRIGSRFNSKCCKLCIDNTSIEWVDEAKYLGINIQSGPKFRCNLAKSKSKFYRSSNAILSKLGNQNNASVSIQLIASISLPTLTYSIEALSLNKSELIILDHPWCRTFQKIFRTFDNNVVRQCQLFTGHYPIGYYYSLRSISFLLNIDSTENSFLRFIYADTGCKDIGKFATMFKCEYVDFVKNYRSVIDLWFLSKLQ